MTVIHLISWNDRVQNILYKNQACRYSKYFKPKVSEELQCQEGLTGLPLKQIIRPFHGKCPIYIHKTGISSSSKVEEYQEKVK